MTKNTLIVSRLNRRRGSLPATYRRRRRRARLELHWLARAKLNNERGPAIHYGVGIYDPNRGIYLCVFHTTPEHGDHFADYAVFSAELQVLRYFVEVAPGAQSRLFHRAMYPQPWSPFRNCQHLVTWILTGRAQSPTLQGITVAVVSVAAVTALVAMQEPAKLPRKRRRSGRGGAT